MQFQTNSFPLQDRKKHTSTEYEAKAKIEIPYVELSGSLSSTNDVSKRQQQEGKMPEELEGFSKLGQYESNTYNPATSAVPKEDKVRLTVYQLKKKCEKKFLAENLSRERNDSCIVTKKGGIVKSLDKDNPWIDMDGQCHNELSSSAYPPDCHDCMTEVMSKKIFETLAQMKQTVLREQKIELLGDVEKIIEKYTKLETKTSGVILEIRLTGQDIIDSLRRLKHVKDNGNEEEIEDAIKLLQNDMMGRISDLKTSTDEVRTEHNVLIGDVNNIKIQLNATRSIFESLFELIVNYLNINDKFISSIPKMFEKLEKELKKSRDDIHITKKRLVETNKAIDKATTLELRSRKITKMVITEAEEKAVKLIRICDVLLRKLKTQNMLYSSRDI